MPGGRPPRRPSPPRCCTRTRRSAPLPAPRSPGPGEAGGAVGPGPDGDLTALPKGVRHRAGVGVPQVQRHDGGPLPGLAVPVKADAGDVPDLLVKAPGKARFAGQDRLPAQLPPEAQRRPEARDAVTVEGPGLQAGGVLLRLGLPVALDPGAAGEKGPDLHPRSHAEAAGALGSHEALVAREAEDVDAHSLHVDGQQPRRLGGVHHQQKSVCPAEFPHPAEIHGVPREVGGVGADHGLGLPPEKEGQGVPVQPPLPVCREEVHRAPLGAEAVQGAQNGVVLPVRGDHVVPRGKEPGDGGIQGGGGVGGKADPLRRAVEELPQQQPRLIDAAPGVQGLAVGPSPAVAEAPQG